MRHFGHGFCHLGEHLKHFVQAEQKDCELENKFYYLDVQKVPIPWIYGNIPIVPQIQSDEPSTWAQSKSDLGDHQHTKLD